ncbi:hypothetical protein [Spongiimicrobium sp. 3-5]|uniref:TapB family protein n=1 Tax=Spongiimicrobium sp. 3-5 TaxID=3332596 RepID=UPI00397EA9C1
MIRTTISFFLAFLYVALGNAQDSCSKYYPFEEDVKFQVTTYDNKNKVSAIVDYKVKDVKATDSGETATFFTSVKDKKEKVIMESQIGISCAGEVVSMDFTSLMSPQFMQQYKDIDVKMSGTNLDLPNNLSVGQQLPDADLQMNMNMAGMSMNMNIHILNRKVVGEETVTTPAGTFDCSIITYDTELKMGMKQQNSSKQWMAPGVGLVKQEDYNKKGKLMSSSLLTSFSK